MITDVFLAANASFRMSGVRVPGQPPPKISLSEAAHDSRTFVRLTDSILDAIDIAVVEEGLPPLDPAWQLLDRLKRRDFYRQVRLLQPGRTKPCNPREAVQP